ncbi:CD48 antigen-like isoform X2 [Thunnus maccoyii]|uniref:CD48 antigen-like isoform X2 n=1 Tax=Thunnus maccoyii TaxID=8240 RepID=UPI001C4CB9A0|nr:CD48 antigen-like isoform X2 [Thunnus maccoyii]
MEAQMRIILFLTVIISSANEEVKNLTSTEGGSITLPDPVKEKGYLSFERTNIAAVNKGEVEIEVDIYIGRLHWDKNNGNFTITGLQRNDSGIFAIDSKKGRIFTKSYKLTVYESVSLPAVNTSNLSAESCILLCSVEKGEETTLLWYKDEEILNQSSSALSLPLTVHKQDFSSSYRCEAANPAEKKTVVADMKTFCGHDDADNSNDTNTRYYFGIIISIVLAVFVVLIAIITKKKCLNKTKTTTRQTQGRFGEHRHRCQLY